MVEQIWGSYLTFDGAFNENLVDEVSEWLGERGITEFKFLEMGGWGMQEVILLFLPVGREGDAALLSLFRLECTDVAKIR